MADTVDTIEQKCLAKGVKLTEQRKIIAKIISESKSEYGESDHPDVDELYNRVSKVDPKISIATVYRTVKLFEEAGILTKHDFKGGKARYETLVERISPSFNLPFLGNCKIISWSQSVNLLPRKILLSSELRVSFKNEPNLGFSSIQSVTTICLFILIIKIFGYFNLVIKENNLWLKLLG